MKFTATFELPDETEEWTHMMQGMTYFIALRCFDEKLRQKVKYSSDPSDKWAQTARDLFWETMRENGVEL